MTVPPVTAIDPPWACWLDASSVPATVTSPSLPSKTMSPPEIVALEMLLSVPMVTAVTSSVPPDKVTPSSSTVSIVRITPSVTDSVPF